MAITRNNPQTLNDTVNASSFTLANCAVTAGANRLLVVRVHAQRGATNSFTLTATFGGVSMTEATTLHVASATRSWRTSIFFLVAPAETIANIVVTSSSALACMILAAETLLGAHQTTPLGATITDTTDPANSLALTGCAADSLILAAVSSYSLGTPTWTWATAAESYDINNSNSAAEAAGSGGHYTVPSAGNVTLTATRSATAEGQVGAAVEFRAAAVAGASQPPRTMHQFRMRGGL